MALRLPKQDYQDIERVIELDFVRATEAAALNSLRWLGRGDKEAADAAASDAIRGMFDLMNICGEVVIGEGIKDDAPGIFKGEQLGTWYPGSPEFHIAIDPIDGTTNISKGAPNSISCIAAASPEEGVKVALRDIPSFYMSKLAYGPRVIKYMKKRGGSPEAVLAAAAIKCLGGDMQCRMWPRDEKERKSLIANGHEKDLDRIYSADDLANGQNIIFCATGVSDSALLPGVRARGGVTAVTHSILMRAKSKTVRFIRARHDLQIKTIRLRSDNREHIL